MQTSLIINSTDANGNAAKSITDVNGDVENHICHEFGRQANALTTHEFKGVNRVDKTNLDENKRTPTLTLAQSSIPVADILAARDTSAYGVYIDINYDGDGKLFVPDYTFTVVNFSIPFVPTVRDGKLFIVAMYGVDSTYAAYNNARLEFTLQASEGKTCNAVSTTFTLTK